VGRQLPSPAQDVAALDRTPGQRRSGRKMTTAKKPIREQRTIRFRAVKPGQDILHDGKWWNVVRPVEPGETITYKDGLDADKKPKTKTVEIGDLYEGRICGYLIKRGSVETIIFAGTNACVKIIRTR
jgi:hypothetical protein